MTTIPAEAVEAAAMAIFGVDAETWALQMPQTQERYRADARAALDAAGRHMLAEAWQDGHSAGRNDPYCLDPNPYRG